MKGDVKAAASFAIHFNPEEKDLQPIYEEIHTSYEHEVNAINPTMFNNLLVQHALHE